MSEEQRDKHGSAINRPDSDSPAAPEADATRAEREHTFTRRALVQDDWVIPAAVVLNLPEIALAASGGPSGHTDVHSDTPNAHIDSAKHGDT